MRNPTILIVAAVFVPGVGLIGASVVQAQSTSPAAGVVLELQSQLNIVALEDLTAATDPDGLLGRPGAYTSKATFHDPLHDPTTGQPSGAVEVFGSSRDRDTRRAALSSSGEVDLAVGGTGLLRLYPAIAQQSQAVAAYRATLGSLLLP
jgi:hypothetical protein